MGTRTFPRFLAFILAACCLAPLAAPAAAPGADQRLVGIWQDDKDPDNIIQFYPDHAVRIYLPRGAAQAGSAHWVDGTWTLAAGGRLTMRLIVPDNGSTPKVKELTVAFTGTGFIVKEGGKIVGRQHRISERTLKKHLW